jgi:hypothetical protein
MTDASLRDRMGREARAFAARNFGAEAYVRKLLDFLADQRSLSQEPVRAALREVSAAVAEAGYPIEKGTAGLEPLMREFHSIVGGPSAQPAEGSPLRTLGIWLGFEHPTPLHREGMSRFLSYLLRHLIEEHGIDCEIWCYSFNETSVQEAFRSLLSDTTVAARIRIVHEKNWSAVFASSVSAFGLPPEVAIEKNNLYELANLVSHADCFLLGICYLDNALNLSKPVFVPLHDLVVLESYRAFVGDNEGFRPYARKIREAVEGFQSPRCVLLLQQRSCPAAAADEVHPACRRGKNCGRLPTCERPVRNSSSDSFGAGSKDTIQALDSILLLSDANPCPQECADAAAGVFATRGAWNGRTTRVDREP